MGLTAAKRWAQVRAAGGQPPAALPSVEPAEKGEQPKGRRPRKPKVTRDEP
jgi:hypothetical protein